MPPTARHLRAHPILTFAAGLLLQPAVAVAGQATPPPSQPAPPCAVAAEPDYARTPESPARVGRSPLYGGARQRRYLESPRGPQGQAVTCSGTTEERSLELASRGAKLLESPMPVRPSGDAAAGDWIAVQAIVDHAGRFREATAPGGPPDLARAAVEILSRWRAEPPRVNGAPLASPVVLQVRFAEK